MLDALHCAGDAEPCPSPAVKKQPHQAILTVIRQYSSVKP